MSAFFPFQLAPSGKAVANTLRNSAMMKVAQLYSTSFADVEFNLISDKNPEMTRCVQSLISVEVDNFMRKAGNTSFLFINKSVKEKS